MNKDYKDKLVRLHSRKRQRTNFTDENKNNNNNGVLRSPLALDFGSAPACSVSVHIVLPGSNKSMDICTDTLKTVADLKDEIAFRTPERSMPSFDLIAPTFRHANMKKQKMEDDRDISDYGLRNGAKLIVVVKIRSGLSGGRVSRKKTRKRKLQ